MPDRDNDIPQQVLGVTPPWEVVDSKFGSGNNRLDLYLGFPKGSTFPGPECGKAH